MSFENLIGTAPNQIPSNSDLGDLAYQNRESVNIEGGTATLDVGNIKKIENTTAISEVEPTLLLDFAKTKTLDPRITFTRASTGAYYDGKTYAKAEENLFLFSQEFNSSYWVKFSTNVSFNTAVAPDGSITADSLIQIPGDTAGARVLANVNVVASDYVISIFAKPNGKNFILFQENALDGTQNFTWFNISAGTIGSTDSGHTATITAAGNGFYRCSIKLTANTSRAAQILFRAADENASTTTIDNQQGIFLWGAQLEQRSTVTAYTPTTTQPITNYIPTLQTAATNTARFDHDPTTGESLGLLIEEQRTNLLTYSEDFAEWAKTRSSIITNTIVAPDGTLTGDKLVTDTSLATSHYVRKNVTLNASTIYAASCYMKAGELTEGAIALFGSNGWSETSIIFVDLLTGSATVSGSGAAGSVIYVGNGWYKVILIQETNATTGSKNFDIYPAQFNTTSIDGDGYSGIYIWGAQVEAGAFPTSYIKTEASQVTRSADSASMTGANFSSWYRQDAGTVYAESFSPADSISGIFNHNWTLSLNVNNWIAHVSSASYGGSGNSLSTRQNNISQGSFIVGNKGTYNKVAYSFRSNDLAGVATNEEVQTDLDAILPYPNELTLGGSAFSAGNTRLTLIKKFVYYPARLSNEELQEMTE